MTHYEMAKDHIEKLRSNAPFLVLLVTIAVLAITSAVYIVKYASDRSYHKKWKDYDDCGLA